MPDAHEMAYHMLSTAREIREKADNVRAMMAIQAGDDEFHFADIASVMQPDKRERAWALYRLGGTLGFGLSAKRIVTVTDAYVSTLNTEGKSREEIEAMAAEAPMPSKDPNRLECLTVTVRTPVGVELILMQTYDSSGRKIDWQEPREMTDAKDLVDNVFPPFFEGQAAAEELLKGMSPDAQAGMRAAAQAAVQRMDQK